MTNVAWLMLLVVQRHRLLQAQKPWLMLRLVSYRGYRPGDARTPQLMHADLG